MKTCLLAVSLFLACSAWGQGKRVSISPPALLTAKAGVSTTQTLDVTVQAGSHVNTDKPRGEFLIPLRLEWEASPLKVDAIHYPEGEELKVGTDQLVVFTGTFKVTTQFNTDAKAAAGKFDVKGKLHFQACNTQMCFRPATVDVVLPVTIQ